MTLVRFPKLNPPGIRGKAKRLALGKVFQQEKITNTAENWLRMSLTHDRKHFLIAEPVLKQRFRSVVWDPEAGVIVAVQDLRQLSKGKIFDKTGDWREARTQIMAQEAGAKVMVSVASNDKGQRSRQQSPSAAGSSSGSKSSTRLFCIERCAPRRIALLRTTVCVPNV